MAKLSSQGSGGGSGGREQSPAYRAVSVTAVFSPGSFCSLFGDMVLGCTALSLVLILIVWVAHFLRYSWNSRTLRKPKGLPEASWLAQPVSWQYVYRSPLRMITASQGEDDSERCNLYLVERYLFPGIGLCASSGNEISDNN